MVIRVLCGLLLDKRCYARVKKWPLLGFILGDWIISFHNYSILLLCALMYMIIIYLYMLDVWNQAFMCTVYMSICLLSLSLSLSLLPSIYLSPSSHVWDWLASICTLIWMDSIYAQWCSMIKHDHHLVGGDWNMDLIFPYIGNNHPSWLIFFRGFQTTN